MSRKFETDEDALDLLKSYGITEKKNGVLQEDRRVFNEETWSAVCYLCDEWDFVFENIESPADPNHADKLPEMMTDAELYSPTVNRAWEKYNRANEDDAP